MNTYLSVLIVLYLQFSKFLADYYYLMANSVLNLNVGILGHVDSGKTTLAKAVSTIASTAAFDKNPQSKERGITIDLGFSSLLVDMPEHLKNTTTQEKLQFTLVDCPGHASLIRTIIGGNLNFCHFLK